VKRVRPLIMKNRLISLSKNRIAIALVLIKDLKDIVVEIYDYLKLDQETGGTVLETTSEAVAVVGEVGREFNFDWWNFITKLIVVTLLWLLWKEYLKQKEDIKILLEQSDALVKQSNEDGEHWYEQINNVAKEITRNLNESNRRHEIRIGYVDFYHENKGKDLTEYVKLLRKEFSVEDLEEAGVPKKFIDGIKDKLMPREFFDELRELKYRYREYKRGTRDIGKELDRILDKEEK